MSFNPNRKVGLKYIKCFDREKDEALNRNDKYISRINTIQGLMIFILILAPVFYVASLGYGTVMNFNIETMDEPDITISSINIKGSSDIGTLGMEDLGGIFGDLGGFISLLLGLGGNGTDAFNETIANSTSLNETISELIDTLNDTHPEITEENFLDYLTNGTLSEIIQEEVENGDIDLDGVVRPMIEDLMRGFFNSTIPSIMNGDWNKTKIIRITNMNDGFFSFIKIKNPHFKASISINEMETIIFQNSSSQMGFGDDIEGYFNLAELFYGIINSTMETLIDVATDYVVEYAIPVGEPDTNLFNEIMNNVLANVFDAFNIEIKIELSGVLHTIGSLLYINVKLSDILKGLLSDIMNFGA